MSHITTLLKASHPTSEVEKRCRESRARCGISSVMWLTTFNCNLRCGHCYTASPRDTDRLDTSEALALVDQIGRLRIPMVFLSGGEPLMREDIGVIARALKRAGARVVISTNGTLIDDDTIAMFKESGVAYAAISLHGPEEVHDHITAVPGTFKKATAAIEKLRREGITVCIKSAVTRKTLQGLPWVLDWGTSVGVKAFYICDLVPAGRGCGTSWLGGGIGREEWHGFFDLLISHIEKSGVFIDIGANPSTVALLLERERLRNPERAAAMQEHVSSHSAICPAGKGTIAVMPDGSVSACNFMPDAVVGNVRKQPLEELGKIVTQSLAGSPAGEPCRSCRWSETCGGCRAKAFYLHGDAREGDPTCLLHRPGRDGRAEACHGDIGAATVMRLDNE